MSRRVAVSLFPVAVIAAMLFCQFAAFTQTPRDTLIEREHARAEANRTGKGREALYRPDYSAIDRNGVVTGYAEVLKAGMDPKYRLEEPFNVQVYGNVALVTGVQQAGAAPGPSRFLRVWVRDGGSWRVVSFHGTSIQTNPANTPVSTRSGVKVAPYPTLTGEAANMLVAQRAINDAFAAMDTKTYDRYTAPEFVRVNDEGASLSRDEFLKTVGNTQQKRVPSGNDEIMIRIYGDIAIESYRNIPFRADGTAGPTERMTRVFVKRGEVWQQVITQSTQVAQSSQRTE